MGLTGPDRECRPPHSRRGSPDGLPESSLQLVCSPPPHASPAHAPCSPPAPHAAPARPGRPAEGPTRLTPPSGRSLAVRGHHMSASDPSSSPVSLCWVRGPSVLVREGTSASRRLALRRVPEAPDPGSAVGLWRFPLRKTSPFPYRDVHLPFVHGSRALCAWTLRLIKPVPTSRCPASPFVEPLFLALTSAGSRAGPRVGPPVPRTESAPSCPRPAAPALCRRRVGLRTPVPSTSLLVSSPPKARPLPPCPLGRVSCVPGPGLCLVGDV